MSSWKYIHQDTEIVFCKNCHKEVLILGLHADWYLNIFQPFLGKQRFLQSVLVAHNLRTKLDHMCDHFLVVNKILRILSRRYNYTKMFKFLIIL
jgi:hypothetical protein